MPLTLYFSGFNTYMAFVASGKMWSAVKAFGWLNLFGFAYTINDSVAGNHSKIVESIHLDQAGQNVKIKFVNSKEINVPI